MRRLLAIRRLRVVRGAREVLRDIELEVSAGEVCGLMGLSGSGKSTILRACAALEPFDGGSIELNGAALAPGPLPPESRLRVCGEPSAWSFRRTRSSRT